MTKHTHAESVFISGCKIYLKQFYSNNICPILSLFFLVPGVFSTAPISLQQTPAANSVGFACYSDRIHSAFFDISPYSACMHINEFCSILKLH